VPPKTLDSLTAIFGRYSALPVDEFRKRVARHSKGFGGGGDGQAQRLDALTQNDASGMRWVFIVTAWFPSVVIDIVNVFDAVVKMKNHPPACSDSHSPKAFHPTPSEHDIPDIGEAQAGRREIDVRIGRGK
jgi:hypothetical protein